MIRRKLNTALAMKGLIPDVNCKTTGSLTPRETNSDSDVNMTPVFVDIRMSGSGSHNGLNC
jgi:hypothetical protein